MSENSMERLPYEHGCFHAMVNVADRDGIVSDGFGDVRVRAGRSVHIEVTDALSGVIVVATLDYGRPGPARTNLQVDGLCEAVQSAAREDGMPEAPLVLR